MNLVLNALRHDPTRTTLLRQTMVADTNARVRALQQATATSSTVIRRAFADSKGYWDKYALQAYRKGLEDSWAEANQQLPKDEFGILRKTFLKKLDAEMRRRAKQLGSRIQAEMEGVGQSVATRVARAVADARDQQLSKANRDKLIREALEYGRNQAARVAHTEITRAFADGQLSAYEEIGMDYVTIEVEWETSGLGVTEKGNPSPCPKCKKFERRRFTLAKAKGLIPLHPFCKCRFRPVFRIKT